MITLNYTNFDDGTQGVAQVEVTDLSAVVQWENEEGTGYAIVILDDEGEVAQEYYCLTEDLDPSTRVLLDDFIMYQEDTDNEEFPDI